MGDEEREQRLFNRTEAEQLLPVIEPLLQEAASKKKQMEEVDKEFAQVQNRILLYGGIVPPYAHLAGRKQERDKLVEAIRAVVERIEETGCVVKDLDAGLIDFPTLIDEEQVYLCWKLGEKRIFYWHRMDEGFAGRKPLEGTPAAGSSDDPKPN
jgi:hypothetical protein